MRRKLHVTLAAFGAYAPPATEGTEAPHASQELLLLEHPLGILGEGDEQLVLLRRELHRVACERHDPRGEVDLELAHDEALMPRPVRPAQDRAHSGHPLV